MANKNLGNAKAAKNDEFYTQYADIEKEVNAYLEYDSDVFRGKTVLLPCDDPEWSNFTKYFAQNFTRLGLRRLISTSYAPDAKKAKYGVQLELSLFEQQSPKFDPQKAETHGRIFVIDHDITGDGRIDMSDLDFQYLEGDGDFRSKELCQLRDEADMIITNPPFSLFREFIKWIRGGKNEDKKFLVLGNMNSITYKEIFPLIKENKIWLGVTSGARKYLKPDGGIMKMGNTCWFTNVVHGRRHEPLQLMTMSDNKKYSRHKKVKGHDYQHYDNYDAIEVPFTDAIPSDYDGVMGVPISFLDKYCPEQFEIMGITAGRDEFEARPTKRYINPMQVNPNGTLVNGSKANTRATIILPSIPNGIYYTADNASGPMQIMYARILIRHKK